MGHERIAMEETPNHTPQRSTRMQCVEAETAQLARASMGAPKTRHSHQRGFDINWASVIVFHVTTHFTHLLGVNGSVRQGWTVD